MATPHPRPPSDSKPLGAAAARALTDEKRNHAEFLIRRNDVDGPRSRGLGNSPPTKSSVEWFHMQKRSRSGGRSPLSSSSPSEHCLLEVPRHSERVTSDGNRDDWPALALQSGSTNQPTLNPGAQTTFQFQDVPDRSPTGPLAYYLPGVLLTFSGNIVNTGGTGARLFSDSSSRRSSPIWRGSRRGTARRSPRSTSSARSGR